MFVGAGNGFDAWWDMPGLVSKPDALFGHVGKSVRLSPLTVWIEPRSISLGNRCYVDSFCVVDGRGGVRIGDFTHVSAGVYLLGNDFFELGDFGGLSNGVKVYTSNENYTEGLTNPTVPSKWRLVESAPVRLGKHCLVGANTVILPGVTLPDGVAIGALSLVKPGEYEPFGLYAGVPAVKVGMRDRVGIEQAEAELRAAVYGDSGFLYAARELWGLT